MDVSAQPSNFLYRLGAMYGKGDIGFPQRIACLSAEHVEICYALVAGDRVVAVPGTAHRPPEACEKPKIGGFTTFRADRIRELEPDLVLAFSDLCAKASACAPAGHDCERVLCYLRSYALMLSTLPFTDTDGGGIPLPILT
jgi:ABC-type hemin transport system substrate-binding protein